MSGPIIRFIAEFPPSSNRYWRKWQNKIVKSERAVEYMAIIAATLHGCDPLVGPVSVSIHAFMPSTSFDLQNAEKVLLDCMQGYAYVNDRQVHILKMYRYDLTGPGKKKRARVMVEVIPYVAQTMRCVPDWQDVDVRRLA